MNLVGRIGCFLLLVGAVLLMLFLASDKANQPELNYLCLGVIGLVGGFMLWRAGQPSPGESKRFRILRKSRSRKKDEPR